jgi:hypothetical protein
VGHDQSFVVLYNRLSGNVFSWFAPFLEKRSLTLQDMAQFKALFAAIFGESDREKVAETKMQYIAPKDMVCCNIYSRISTAYM